MKIRIGILTLSDKGYRGEREDTSSLELEKLAISELDAEVVEIFLLPDERTRIAELLEKWCDSGRFDLILTTGGTGMSPSDITPEATLDVIERRAPGFEEAMRAASLKITPHAMISRAVVGMRKSTLIVNLPGSPKGATENLQAILSALPHALKKLHGDPSDCATP
jgi:molybdopterin adenylyltransferase